MGQKSKNSSQQIKIRKILAIETSCDDTSVAVVGFDGFVFGQVSENQDAIHSRFGGVIPELACRSHTMRILPLIEELLMNSGITWNDIEGIAVTNRPGLLGSLLIGVTVAKTLALIHDLPLVGVNHLEGHLYAPFLKDAQFDLGKNLKDPFVGLCVSGGHTSLVHVSSFGKIKTLGRTLDDAAGEAFDKFGKVLGLGYPAGRLIDENAKNGNKKAFDFPRPLMTKKNLDFSFSGLKTAGHQEVKKYLPNLSVQLREDFCASFQEAIVDVLIKKLELAIDRANVMRAVITGGVSSNSRLRERALESGHKNGFEVLMAPPRYCTDNAAMIGRVGIEKLNLGLHDDMKLSAIASSLTAEIV